MIIVQSSVTLYARVSSASLSTLKVGPKHYSQKLSHKLTGVYPVLCLLRGSPEGFLFQPLACLVRVQNDSFSLLRTRLWLQQPLAGSVAFSYTIDYQRLELRHLLLYLIYCYKIVVGLCTLQIFSSSPLFQTNRHAYKIL